MNNRNTRHLFALAVLIITFLICVATIGDYGITWDEPIYAKAAQLQNKWISNLVNEIINREPIESLSTPQIDRYWNYNTLHPSVTKLLMGVSQAICGSKILPVTAARLSIALVFALFVAVMFAVVSLQYGTWVAILSCLFFATMPRIFSHAHFASIDMYVAAMYFFTMVSFYKGLSRPIWSTVFGLLAGATVATKLSGIAIVPAVLIWAVFACRNRSTLIGLVRNTLFAVLLAPVVFVVLNPSVWPNISGRIQNWMYVSTHHYIWHKSLVYFLGDVQVLPRWYPPFITLITTPPLVILGVAFCWKKLKKEIFQPKAGTFTYLMLSMVIASFVISCAKNAPRYDGVRLFLSVFAPVSILAAVGYKDMFGYVSSLWRSLQKPLFLYIIIPVLILPEIFALVKTYPFGLSYYNCFVGGISGAQKIGFETTYWGDTLNPSVIKWINQNIPDGSRIGFCGLGRTTIDAAQSELGLKRDIHFVETDFSQLDFDYALLNCRQGEFTASAWFLYREMQPVYAVRLGKTQLLEVYSVRDMLKKYQVSETSQKETKEQVLLTPQLAMSCQKSSGSGNRKDKLAELTIYLSAVSPTSGPIHMPNLLVTLHSEAGATAYYKRKGSLYPLFWNIAPLNLELARLAIQKWGAATINTSICSSQSILPGKYSAIIWAVDKKGNVINHMDTGTLVIHGQRKVQNHGLVAEYYANPEWQGEALATYVDTMDTTGHNFSYPYRLLPHAFSVTFSGYIAIAEKAKYEFALTSDDGSWLYIGGQEIIHNEGIHSAKVIYGRPILEPGIYPIKLKYFDAGSEALVKLDWDKPRNLNRYLFPTLEAARKKFPALEDARLATDWR